MAKSSLAYQNFVPGTSRTARSRHSLLVQMAKDAAKLAEQAERIKELRALARVSQLKAANAIGVTPRAYQSWEAGDSDLSRDNLAALAEYFGSTPDYIEYGTIKRERGPTPEPLQAVDATHADRLEERLAAIEQQLLQLSAIQDQLTEMARDNESRGLELISHIDERTAPLQAAPQRRRRA